MREIHASLQEMTMIAQVFKNNIDKTVLNQTEAKFISRQNEKCLNVQYLFHNVQKMKQHFNV